jgi:hypothetical protein
MGGLAPRRLSGSGRRGSGSGRTSLLLATRTPASRRHDADRRDERVQLRHHHRGDINCGCIGNGGVGREHQIDVRLLHRVLERIAQLRADLFLDIGIGERQRLAEALKLGLRLLLTGLQRLILRLQRRGRLAAAALRPA